MNKSNRSVMLEYFKTILSKVSFDQRLFEKELRKATQRILNDEKSELKMWCYNNYGEVYPDVLQRCFRG